MSVYKAQPNYLIVNIIVDIYINFNNLATIVGEPTLKGDATLKLDMKLKSS